jgi:hypothetical protein
MHKILGKWKITEMEQWDLKFIDEQGPGYFEFQSNSQGSVTIPRQSRGL